MTGSIKPTKGRCPFCPTKGGKEQTLFAVKTEGLATVICGEHLWGYLQAQEEAAQANGQSVVHESPG